MQSGELHTDSALLMRTLAGRHADRYIAEFIVQPMERLLDEPTLTIQDIRSAYADAYDCLRTIYAHYAFSRRGKDRAELSKIALEALDRTCEPETFEEFLAEPDASRLWNNFTEICSEQNRKPTEQLNIGVIAGMAELAQDIFRIDHVGSIAGWILKGVLQTDHLEPQFLRIVDIRGVGPKIASLFIRDVIHIFGVEGQIDRLDRIYIQPIDKWIRLIAPYVVPEPDADEMADWILAGKLTKYARLAGVSGIRFNMGATCFGIKDVKNPDAIESSIDELLE